MKIPSSTIKYTFLLLLIPAAFACTSQGNNKTPAADKKGTENLQVKEDATQIGDYVVETFEDSKGKLWFGTLGKGVARYDGKSLTYFTTTDGLLSNRVVSIIEDDSGHIWFGTGAGLSKFDGKTFTNFTTKDGLCDHMISDILIDSRGDFWVGTWGGVCQFDGTTFTEFKIPTPTIKTTPNEDTKNWVTTIIEDSKGNIWFGRDGYGACKYDGKEFVHFLKEDGLYSNNVQCIAEDKDGHIWFGSRVAEKDNPDASRRFGQGGVTKYDGEAFFHYPEIKGLSEDDVYEIHKDISDQLWIGTLNNGIYRYDGMEFKNFHVSKSIMSVTKDRNGHVWLGCAGGLFCINANGVVNVTTVGPWE